MNSRITVFVLSCLAATVVQNSGAGDWPQWRGPNRDARVSGFSAPQTWPQKLAQKWKVTVGGGVATPALVGNKLYVFSRQDDHEVIRCLDAASGQEFWQHKYEAKDASGAAARFPVLGPRSSPAVAAEKVVTISTRGIMCCLNAASGKLVWQKDQFHAWPRFFEASSPIIVDGLCIAQLGGDRDGDGGISAYDLATGSEKWKWTGDGPAYGSPVLATVDGMKMIVAPTAGNLVAVSLSDGKLLWEMSYTQGRYNAATPIIDGETLIFAGPTRGITAEKLVKKGDKLTAERLWSDPDNSVIYNTPVLKNGLLFGLSNLDSLFCINISTGKTAWNAPVGKPAAGQRAGAEAERRNSQASADEGQQRRGRQRGRGSRRGMGGGGGYGSIVDAGEVLFALSPAAELIVFKPSDESYAEVARYKVADGSTYSYPVIADNRIFIKDKDSVTLWTVE